MKFGVPNPPCSSFLIDWFSNATGSFIPSPRPPLPHYPRHCLKGLGPVDGVEKPLGFPTSGAPTSYKPNKRPYKWVTEVITPISGVITLMYL